MDPSVLYRKRDIFSEHNLALDFLLGVASFSLDLAERCDQEARLQAHLTPAVPEADADQVLYFMLGLLTVSTRFNQILADEKKDFDSESATRSQTAVSEIALDHIRHLLR